MEITMTRAGAQTATFYVPSDAAVRDITFAQWAQLPAGQLKTLLTGVYVTNEDPAAPDYAAFASACADVGLSVAGAVIGGGAIGEALTLSDGSDPAFGPVGTPVCEGINASLGTVIRFVTVYSASE